MGDKVSGGKEFMHSHGRRTRCVWPACGPDDLEYMLRRTRDVIVVDRLFIFYSFNLCVFRAPYLRMPSLGCGVQRPWRG